LAYLDAINSPDDIKRLGFDELESLTEEIRAFLIDNISATGGHLASNLGVVELTLAIHKVFSSPKDKIIWDVGHQSYVHKIITGRKDKFLTLRKEGGLSGFPKIQESVHDCFNTGHSSTSISAALGIAKARDIKKEKYSVIAVIGDGALTGGMAFEALNDAGRSTNDLIVILNDNGMSISRNVGGLSKYLSKIRTEPLYSRAKEDLDNILKKIPRIGDSAVKALKRAKGTIKYMIMPGMLFEDLGFKYLGPIYGHDIRELTNVLLRAKNSSGPVLVHVCTNKGKGYAYAENNPSRYHGVGKFDVETGEVIIADKKTYSDIFGEHMVSLASKDPSITAITAAMPDGTGLIKFSEKFPDRFFDVGIAEQHAVTFAAGLSSNSLKPVVAIYSSFLQRAYDQILHDVALQNLHVIFCIDRAGIVGEDGETHQGIYDLSFLSHIPNMIIMAPSDYSEMKYMLDFAVNCCRTPVALRYPKGIGPENLFRHSEIKLGKAEKIEHGKDISIIAVGSMVEIALRAVKILNKFGISCDFINARFIKPLDETMILESVMKTQKVVTIEDNVIVGGFGAGILNLLAENNISAHVKLMGLPDAAIPHGTRAQILSKYGLDIDSIVNTVLKIVRYKKHGKLELV